MAVLKTITIDGVQYQLIQKADDDSLGGIKTGFNFDHDDNKNYYGIKLNDSAKAYIEIDKTDLNTIDKKELTDTNIITPKNNTIFVYNSNNVNLPPNVAFGNTSLILNLFDSTLNTGKTCTVIANNISEIKIGTVVTGVENPQNINNLIKNNVYWEGTQIDNNDNNSKYKIDITRLTSSSPASGNPIGEFIISKSKYTNTAAN